MGYTTAIWQASAFAASRLGRTAFAGMKARRLAKPKLAEGERRLEG